MTMRIRLFVGHLLVTLLVLSVIAFAALSWWSPEPYMTAEGGWPILIILVVVGIVVGPLLTLLLYKPGKKGLLLDLVLVGIVQVGVIALGAFTIFDQRPVFLVFAVDRFTLVSKGDIDISLLGANVSLPHFSQKPIPVYARMPEIEDEKSKLMQEVLEGKPDLEFRSEYYEPMRSNISALVSRSIDNKNISDNSSHTADAINDFVDQHCLIVDRCVFFPLIGKKKEMLLVLNRENGKVVGAVNIDPWEVKAGN
ncbi:MAG: hypothetical protein P8Y28_15335 [Gammaproteobacteria bacterium]